MTISRRTILRAGSSTIALPFLASLLPRGARAQATTAPKRLVIWVGWWGTLPQYYQPTGTGAGYGFSEILKPLESLRSKLQVLTGINMASVFKQLGLVGNHDIGNSHMLTSIANKTVYPWGPSTPFTLATGPSIDQVVADKLNAPTPFKSLFIGDHNDHNSGVVHTLDGKTPSPERNPYMLFQALFGGQQGDAVARTKRKLGRQSVLDAVLPQVTSLQGKVSTSDKRLVDAHLTSIREVEKRLQTTVSCTPPAAPANTWDPYNPATDGLNFTPGVERYQLLHEMLRIALSCDLTRVATVTFSGTHAVPREVVPDFDALQPSNTNGDPHSYSHGTWREPGNTQVWKHFQIWRMNMLRDFATKLQSTQEGEANLLDNTVVLHVSEIMTGLHDLLPHQEWGYSNRMDDSPAYPKGLPIFYLGSAGGKLKTGEHLELSGSTWGTDLGKYCHGELYLTIARALGITPEQLPSFGDPDLGKRVISEILT